MKDAIDYLIEQSREDFTSTRPAQSARSGSTEKLPGPVFRSVEKPVSSKKKAGKKKPKWMGWPEDVVYLCPVCKQKLPSPQTKVCPRCQRRFKHPEVIKVKDIPPAELLKPTKKVNVMPSGAVIKMPVKKKDSQKNPQTSPSWAAKTTPSNYHVEGEEEGMKQVADVVKTYWDGDWKIWKDKNHANFLNVTLFPPPFLRTQGIRGIMYTGIHKQETEKFRDAVEHALPQIEAKLAQIFDIEDSSIEGSNLFMVSDDFANFKIQSLVRKLEDRIENAIDSLVEDVENHG